jgi:uncharacterized membrane protein
MFPYCLILTLTCAGALIAASFTLAASGRELRPGEHGPTRQEMRSFLLWGLVYSNPDDPRGWVPKPRGFGWTVNVRSPSAAQGYAILALITILSVLATVATAAEMVISRVNVAQQ